MGLFDRLPANFKPGAIFQLGRGNTLRPAGANSTTSQFLQRDSSGDWDGHTLVLADVGSVFDATAPTTSAVGDAAAAGSAATAAHRDHLHGREAFAAPTASAVGDAGTTGTATSLVHSDHKHAREAFAAPTTEQTVGSSAATGSATTVPHSDHAHGNPTATSIAASLAPTSPSVTALTVVNAGAQSLLTIGANVANSYSTLLFMARYLGASGAGQWKWEATNSIFYIADVTASNANRLELSTAGAFRFNAYGAGTLSTDGSGNITASDRRLKDVLGPMSAGLAEVLRLNPVRYLWKPNSGFDLEDGPKGEDGTPTKGKHRGTVHAGFIAQEVGAVIPEALGKGVGDFYNFDDRSVIGALVNAVKELSAKNEDLAARLAAVEARIPGNAP